MKKTKLFLALICAISLTACSSNSSSSSTTSQSFSENTFSSTSENSPEEAKYKIYAKMSAKEIVGELSLEQKAADCLGNGG